MKKIIDAIGPVIIAMAFSACTAELVEVPAPSGDFDSVVMHAHNFVWAENPPTKTNLTIDDVAGAVFSWAAGEIVGIYPDVGTQVRFPIVEGEGANTQTARFTGGGWAVKGAHEYMAYYPFIPDMDLDKTHIPVDYRGQVQHGNSSTAHLGAFDFMAAASSAPSDGAIDFDFNHLGSLLMLNLTVPKIGEYNSLVLSTHGANSFITQGTIDITAAVPGITATAYSNEFVVNLSNLITTEVNQTVIIYLLIPPVNMSGQRIFVNLMGDHANCETWFDRGDNKPFQPGHAYRPQMGDMVGGDVIKLENGHQFNEDIKSLVNGEHFIYEKTDFRIESVSFEVNNSAAPAYTYVDVSAPESPAPIYAYWKPGTKELVIRTSTNKVFANEDASGMFNKLNQLTDIDFTGFDLTYTTSVSSMFNDCYSLVNLDLSGWNTGGVQNFSTLFQECKKLANLDISGFDMTSATSTGMMFGGCRSLTALDLRHFNTPNVQDIGYMFYLCESLESIQFGSGFNTSRITGFDGIFAGCKSLGSIDISMFDTSHSTSYYRLFLDCNSLTSITGNLPVTSGDNVGEMYMGCFLLPAIDVSQWDVSDMVSLDNVFSGCHTITTLDVSGWTVSSVKSFVNTFSDCWALETLDVSGWNTSSAEDMYRMFAGCSSLTTLDVSGFITNNVRKFGRMFEGCSSVTALDVSNFNTESADEGDYLCSAFGGMFSGCSSLTTLDVSSFSMGNAYWIGGMFSGCSSLQSIDLSSFNTSQIINMNGLFNGCSSLSSITFGTFDTHYCEDFGDMFRSCSSLQNLNLTFFNTSSAKSMTNMFCGCSGLQTLNISTFDTSHVSASMESMFRDCHNLTELRLGSSFGIVGPWYFATDLARNVSSCTIYCTQAFKNAWTSTEGIYGPDLSKLVWLNCDTGEPLA